MIEKVLRQVFQKANQAGTAWSPTQSEGQNDIKYVFSSEGIYTGMFSGLNLEEELRIGGNKQITYELGQNLSVVEKYFLENNKNIYYKIETFMNTDIVRFIVNGDDFIVTSEENGSFLILSDEKKSFNDNIITVRLSKVKDNEETVIKEKHIIFSDMNGKKVVTETLVI